MAEKFNNNRGLKAGGSFVGFIADSLSYKPEETEEKQEKSLADYIVEAYQMRLEEHPETVKEEIEEYLGYLDPEDRKAFLREKLEELGG